MAKFRANIPNFLTLCNLFSGALGIVFLQRGLAVYASICILAGSFFDLTDGLAARLLRSHSAIGKELDSLADLVTFGVLPSLILFQLMERSLVPGIPSGLAFLPYASLLIAVFTAIRLARFNLESGDNSFFEGLPSPANGLVIASIPLIAHFYPVSAPFFTANIWWLLFFTGLSCVLLVSKIKLISLKFQTRGWKRNEGRFLFITGSIISILLFKFASVPVIIFLYFLFSYLHQALNAGTLKRPS